MTVGKLCKHESCAAVVSVVTAIPMETTNNIDSPPPAFMTVFYCFSGDAPVDTLGLRGRHIAECV